MSCRFLLGLPFAVSAAVLATAQSRAPVVVRGDLPSLNLPSEEEPENMLLGAVAVGALYDDNVFSNNNNRVGDLSYVVAPRVTLTKTHGDRLHWLLNFSPQLIKHQNITVRDYFNIAAGADLEYQPAKRFGLHFQESYRISSEPFLEGMNQSSGMPEISMLSQPNDSIIAPLATHTTNITSLDASYRLGARTTVEGIGDFLDVRLQDLPGFRTRYIDTRSFGGRGIYSYRLTSRHSVGVMYSYEDMTFTREQPAKDISQGIMYLHTVAFTPRMNLQLYAGPEHSTIDNVQVLGLAGISLFIPIHQSVWSWASGSTFGWQGNHTSFRAMFLRQVGGGGGLLTAVRSTEESIEIRHQLAPGWISYLGGNYSDNQLLGVASTNASIRGFTAGAGVTRKLRTDLELELRYVRAHQDRKFVLGGIPADHNRVSATLEYQLKHSLGR
jgi:hypothetical protein